MFTTKQSIVPAAIVLAILYAVYFGAYVGLTRMASAVGPTPTPDAQADTPPTLDPTAETTQVALAPSLTASPARPTALPPPTLTAPPTLTRVPTITNTPPPTATLVPTRTATRLPTATVVPQTRTNPNFRADRTAINRGECVNLRWNVEGIRAVYLDGEGKTGNGAQSVCPSQTRSYTLTVEERDGRRVDWPVTVEVNLGGGGGGGGPPPPPPPPPPPSVAVFTFEDKGCEGGVGVKGQVFDVNGKTLARRATVYALVNGQPGVLPPGRVNEAGWYEWFTSANQDITINRVEVDGRTVTLSPSAYTVRSQPTCFQYLDIRQQR